jgi:predicted Na+-dependent transporter
VLDRLNKFLEKVMPLITPSGVIFGIISATWLHSYGFLAPWIFAWMTFTGSLGSNYKDMGKVLKHPLPIIAIFIILHVLMPLVGWGIGDLFFPGDDLTQTGFVLLFVIPTGISSVIWVSIYGGNIALTLALILLDTLLSPLIVPYSLSVLVGAKVQMNSWDIMQGLLWMVVIPSLIGMAMNQISKGKVKTKWSPTLAPFSKIGLFLVVALNSSVVAPYLHDMDMKLVSIIVLAFFGASLGYLIGWLVAKTMRWDRDITIALTFNSGMRNISTGAVLAITFFPAPVAVPAVAGILFQQILASLYGHQLGKRLGLTGKPVTKAA